MVEPRYLECFVLDSIDGQNVNQFSTEHPLNRQFTQRLLAHCPVAVVWPDEAEGFLSFNDSVTELNTGSGFMLEQPSEDHCRSFQLLGEAIPTEFEDEFGNLYYTVGLKGNNLRNPFLMESSTGVDSYIPYGLQESAVAARVILASRTLASRGISTEYVFGLAEPKTLPWPVLAPGVDASVLVGRGEFRERLIEDYLAELPEDELGSEKTGKIISSARAMAFYITLRAIDSPFRLSDMERDHQRKRVFEFINNNMLRPGEEPLDPAEVEDLRRYVSQYVAPKIGENLAMMHPDLSHGYLNSLNISALAAIVDLDSVRGETLGLGDEPVNDQDRARDVMAVLNALSSIYYHGYDSARLAESPDIEPHMIFLRSYFKKIRESMGSDEDFFDYRVRMFSEIQRYAYGSEKTEHGWALLAVVDELAQDTAKEYLQFFGLREKQVATIVSTEIRNISDNDLGPVFDSVGAEFFAHVDDFALICVREFLNDAVKADQKGEAADPFKSYMESDIRENTETWRTMQYIIRNTYIGALVEHLTGSDTLKELIPHDMNRMLVVGYLFYKIEQTMATKPPTERLLSVLLNKYKVELEAAMHYEIPRSQFPEARDDSFIDVYWDSSAAKRYWRSTEHVPVKQALDLLAKVGTNMSLEDLRLTSTRALAIKPSRPGAIIEEIVFDVSNGGNVAKDGSDTLEIYFSDLPEYVLVIERLEDGSYNYRMFEEPSNLVTMEARVIEQDEDQDEKDRQLTFDELQEAA